MLIGLKDAFYKRSVFYCIYNLKANT